MPNFILLTGAGFSRNWGGWLANEVFEYLLSCRELDDHTRQLLWKTKENGGFERALEELGESKRGILESALSGMFNLMNQGLEANFEFTNDMRYQVGTFLARFGAIFTLNQDVLLELHYIGDPSALRLAPSGRSNGAFVPCVRPFDNSGWSLTKSHALQHAAIDDANFRMDPRGQAYCKLHGSSNWLDPSGRRLLIMGGGKEGGIASSKLLAFLWSQFEQHLSRPDTRLLVIGYGFRDHHVNTAIATAAKGGQLKIFVIDQHGVDVLDKSINNPAMQIKAQTDRNLGEIQNHLIGGSRRSLREIFGGRDLVEFAKVMRFFEA